MHIRNPPFRGSLAGVEYRHERFLRDIDGCYFFHPCLTPFLLFEQFAFSADIAAVAFGGDVFADRLDRFSGDDLAADRGLEGYLKQVAVDFFFEFLEQVSATELRFRTMHDHRECIDFRAVDEDVHFDEFIFSKLADVVIHRAVAGGDGFEFVEEVVDDFGEGQFVFEDLAVVCEELLGFVDAAPLFAELHDVADAIGGRDDFRGNDRLADFDDVAGVR